MSSLTMLILQAYQADLLRDLDDREGVGPDVVRKLCRATDLSFRATKEIACTIGRFMTAMVAVERHLLVNLSDFKEKDRAFLLDAPLSPPGLFGNAVNIIVERFQEAKKHYLPCRPQTPWAAEREKP